MTNLNDANFLSNCWTVLVLYLIPFGGGIPAGVIKANELQLQWPIMMVLYFISDLILACVFEPLIYLFLHLSHRNPALMTFRKAFKQTLTLMQKQLHLSLSPFSLIIFTFGADPMTGRLAAFSAGHKFITGWALVIAGDMLFFVLVMASTLWLNSLLGNGTVTAILVTILILAFPTILDKIRGIKR